MQKFTSQAKIIVLALALALGISYASAASTWTGPSATPPGGNADVPINVGNNAQSKAGDLSVGAFLANLNSMFLGTVTIKDKLTIQDGTQGAGKVLTSDASGLASWATASTGGGGSVGVSNNAYEIECVAAIYSVGQTNSAERACFRLNTNTGAVVGRSTGNGNGNTSVTIPVAVSGSGPYSLAVAAIQSGQLGLCVVDNVGASECSTGSITLTTGWTAGGQLPTF